MAECTAFISPMLQVGGGKKTMHGFVVITEHVWNPLSTFRFPKLLVRIWYTLAGEILPSVTTAVHEMLHIHSRTYFTRSMWHSSVADVRVSL
jgi:hypothetical protein